jgi:hypothetical protein
MLLLPPSSMARSEDALGFRFRSSRPEGGIFRVDVAAKRRERPKSNLGLQPASRPTDALAVWTLRDLQGQRFTEYKDVDEALEAVRGAE